MIRLIINRKILISVLIIIATAIIILFIDKKNSETQPRVCVRNTCFDVEIAKTAAERERGLMFRKSLSENSGMLFIFENSGIYPFWMKNTLIPLDIVWINENKEVVFIKKNAQPCIDGAFCENINPQVSASYVFETNAGEAEKLGILTGDKFELINI